MKVYLTSLGCRLNEAELQTWAQEFLDYGISVVGEATDVDAIVINTCAVTGEAARKSRQTIRRYHRINPNAKIIITGCYVSLEKNQAENLLGVDMLISNSEKGLLAKKTKELLEWQAMPFAASEPDESALFVRNKERAFIKIQDGCRYRCTYCIVTIARGEENSRSTKELIKEINNLSLRGVREIVLTGVHVGGYGTDLGTSLYQLVVAILERTEVPRIRFASVEPWDLPDNFFELFRNPRLMPHMHLPMQSGSDKILRKMSRRCKTQSFLNMIRLAKKIAPDFNITSDIIVGFPGESEDDFEQTLQLVEDAKFGHVHIFSYSRREGTKAARLNEQIAENVKKERSQKMHLLASKIKQQELESMLKKNVEVLWEGNGKRQENGRYRYFGYTPNYYKVCVELENEIHIGNKTLSCTIRSVDNAGFLYASLDNESLSSIKQIAITLLESASKTN